MSCETVMWSLSRSSRFGGLRGGVAQWVERLTRDRWILVSSEFEPHQRPRCFLEQETLL